MLSILICNPHATILVSYRTLPKKPISLFGMMEFMISNGVDKNFINVVVGIHFPTKFGLAKGITQDYIRITGKQPTKIKTYIEDYNDNWI